MQTNYSDLSQDLSACAHGSQPTEMQLYEQLESNAASTDRH